jgi:uncharacterized membrane protein
MALAGSVQSVGRKGETFMWDQVEDTLRQSTVRVLSQFANLLPGAMALVVALLFAGALAWLLSAGLRRFLQSVHFDDQLKRWGFIGITEWSPHESPTLLVTRVIAWSIVLFGFVLGLAAFDESLTSRLAFNLFAYVPNVIGALVLVTVGSILARYLARNVLIEGVNMNFQYARLLSVGIKWMVMVLTTAMALDHLRIASGIVHLAFGILFGGIVFALALAVGLGAKETVSRSLERESERASAVNAEELFRHF